MIAVIQCAGSKNPAAGYLVSDSGDRLMFVARPDLAPSTDAQRFVHPDDQGASAGYSWREEVVAYNERSDDPLRLYRAWELYKPATYGRLVSKLGAEQVYILSAGWGLVRSDFRLPQYDITFTSQVKKKRPWAHRRQSDVYRDLSQLPDNTTAPVYFFGGKDYVRLFCDLTRGIAGPRTVFYNSAVPPRAPGCSLEPFDANRNRNWHYDCAEWFLDRL